MKSEEAAVEAAKVCSSGSDLPHELTEENEENMQVESDGISDRRVVLYRIVIPFPRGVMMWDTSKNGSTK